jgi:hypothetical protein
MELQDWFGSAYDASAKRVGEGELAERAAYEAVKEKYELENDHWVPKQD